jgi:predicted acetyltransferase
MLPAYAAPKGGSMDITLTPVSSQSHTVLKNLFQLYMYDMSAFTALPLTEEGCFSVPDHVLAPYDDALHHWAYLIYSDNELAGFAMLRRYPEDMSCLDMDQFFIINRFRGSNVGKTAFRQLVAQHQGNWQIRILRTNTPAHYFWQSAVRNLVGGAYQRSEEKDRDLIMTFIRFSYEGGVSRLPTSD